LRESGRSIRRHNRERMKRKAEVVTAKWGCNLSVSKLADNLAFCSCSMCGNPRRWFKKKTIQELKSE